MITVSIEEQELTKQYGAKREKEGCAVRVVIARPVLLRRDRQALVAGIREVMNAVLNAIETDVEKPENDDT